MTKEQILEIHKNNMDLNVANLAAISGKTLDEIEEILEEDS